ncbi:MAG: putative membrane protein YfcA [Glaciecola sp.]|jgi:uncharacterized membrane protein YfcA
MDLSTIIIGVAGGFAAGVINIISGSGSIITLSLMAFCNVPLDVANGTNRIGILANGIKGTHAFKKKGELHLEDSWKIILLCMTGAIGGIITALYISPEAFSFSLGIIFSLLLLILIFEPHKRLKENKKTIKFIPWLMIPIGFYGGFIQVATGIFLLTVLHIVSGKPLKEINPLKVFMIMLFNIPAILIFAMGGKINWALGISLAVGQYFGAIVGVKINTSNKNIEPAIRYLLITLVIVSIAKFWGAF